MKKLNSRLKISQNKMMTVEKTPNINKKENSRRPRKNGPIK